MSARDRLRWDERHRVVGGHAEVMPVPPDALRGVDVPTAGRALDVACGRGASTVWLALLGLAVDAVDISAVGLADGAALAGRYGVADRVRWWERDLDTGLPSGCAGPYDVVVCQRFRDPALYPALRAALAPGGLVAVTVLSEVDDDPGEFRARRGELAAAFDGLEVLAAREGNGEATFVGWLR